MKIVKVLGTYLAAEIFCLFIGLTLAGSSITAMRVVCSVCTAGILIVLLANLAIKTAHGDLKQERITGKKTQHTENIAAGLSASLPAAASWIVLKISVSSGKFDFYRWHKLINAPFLQMYNLIESDASSKALSSGEVYTMLIFVFIPASVYLMIYALTYKDLIFTESKQP